jgi:hypothetical protein
METMSELTIALMNNGYDKWSAAARINEMREAVLDGENPEELLYDEGLEPDYVFEILTF